MDVERSVAILKALADRSRLRIVGALLDAPRYVEELAERLDLAASTVSFHLKKLEAAGLVKKTRDQYYRVYAVDPAVLALDLRALVATDDGARAAQRGRMQRYRAKVLAAFFEDGRLLHMPAQRKKRRIVLDTFLARFEPDREYGEHEVTAVIAPVFDDYCEVRRALIDEQLMTRARGRYRLTAAGVTAAAARSTAPSRPERGARPMDKTTNRKKQLKAQYKQAPKTAGVFRVVNRATGKVLLGSSLDLHGPLNKHEAELRMGSHRNRALQADWDRDGPDAFSFEVVERVEVSADPTFRVEAALQQLEDKWLEALRPVTPNGYNPDRHIRWPPKRR